MISEEISTTVTSCHLFHLPSVLVSAENFSTGIGFMVAMLFRGAAPLTLTTFWFQNSCSNRPRSVRSSLISIGL